MEQKARVYHHGNGYNSDGQESVHRGRGIPTIQFCTTTTVTVNTAVAHDPLFLLM